MDSQTEEFPEDIFGRFGIIRGMDRLRFRTQAEVLREWDDIIARVKAGEVSPEDAEAFKREKGSIRQGNPRRDWGARTSTSVR